MSAAEQDKRLDIAMHQSVDHLFMFILSDGKVACIAKAVCANGICALGLKLDCLDQGKIAAAFENRAVKTVVQAEYPFQIAFSDGIDLGAVERA